MTSGTSRIGDWSSGAVRRSARIALIVGLVFIVSATAAWFGFKPVLKRREVVGAISRYNVAVSRAYSTMSESPLRSVAATDEVGRITTYMVKLDGENTIVDSELLELTVTSYRSDAPTYTVTTVERWRISERDKTSGQLRSKARTEKNRMKYTLIDTARGVVVFRADLIEPATDKSE